MTEQEWLGCGNFHQMLEYFRNGASERKLRLLCVGLCRHIWDLLDDAGCRIAVEVTEKFADKLATQEELERAYSNTTSATTAANKAACYTADSPFHFYYAGETAVCVLDAVTIFAQRSSFDVENQFHIGLLLDLFGNRFRPITLDPTWLSPKVVSFAQGIYDARTFDRMPELADALEEAGCTDPDILAHCRGPGPHVRGCWLVDLLLGKD